MNPISADTNCRCETEKTDPYEPVEDKGYLAPGRGYYEDLIMFQNRALEKQQQVIDGLTRLVSRLSNAAGDRIVDAEVY